MTPGQEKVVKMYEDIEKGLDKQQEILSLRKALKEKGEAFQQASREATVHFREYLILYNRHAALTNEIVKTGRL